jgi:hypothetical protein
VKKEKGIDATAFGKQEHQDKSTFNPPIRHHHYDSTTTHTTDDIFHSLKTTTTQPSRHIGSSMAEREGTPMVEGPAHGVLGTLWLVGKKTGVDLQSFPIDAEVMTIGR